MHKFQASVFLFYWYNIYTKICHPLNSCLFSYYVTMDALHNKRTHTHFIAHTNTLLLALFATPKIPKMFSFTCVMLPVWSHPTHSWEHKPKCVYVCMCNREHVLFFLFFFLLFHVWVCSPLTQLRAKPPVPCWECTRAMGRLHYRHGRTTVLLYHRTFFSLHPCPRHCSPCAHTDTHKMLLGEGWAAVCLVTTNIRSHWHIVQMQR